MVEEHRCSGEGDCPYPWLEEMLCEYVDGTMEPAVRRAFEEYVHADSDLAEYVERLRCVRGLLCSHRCRVHASEALLDRMQQRVACEMTSEAAAPLASRTASHLKLCAGMASAMMVMFMFGMLVGTSFSGEETAMELADAPAAPPTTEQAALQATLPAFPLQASAQAPSVSQVSMALMMLRAGQAAGLSAADSLREPRGFQKTHALP